MDHMEALDIIKGALFCSGFCFMMYNTEAIVYYAKLLRLSKPLKIEEYKCYKIAWRKEITNYFEFLLKKSNHFLLALLSCPFCFGFWLCLFSSSFRVFDSFVVYSLFLLFYKLIIWQK